MFLKNKKKESTKINPLGLSASFKTNIPTFYETTQNGDSRNAQQQEVFQNRRCNRHGTFLLFDIPQILGLS